MQGGIVSKLEVKLELVFLTQTKMEFGALGASSAFATN